MPYRVSLTVHWRSSSPGARFSYPLSRPTSLSVVYIYKHEKLEWMPSWADIKQCWGTMLRSSVIGFFLGLLPGCSPSVTVFVAYDVEKRVSKHPELFGKGAIEGVAAPEGANNATVSGCFVPLFAFGLPTGPAMAVLLGGLMMYGLQPGPMLFKENPQFVWAVIASMYIGNVILLVWRWPRKTRIDRFR